MQCQVFVHVVPHRNTRMGPPCKQRSQTVENWNSGGGSGSEGWPVERLQQTVYIMAVSSKLSTLLN